MGRRQARAAGFTAAGLADAAGVCPTWLLPCVLQPITKTRARLQSIAAGFITNLLVKRSPGGSVTAAEAGVRDNQSVTGLPPDGLDTPPAESTDMAAYEAELAKSTIGQPQPLTGPIEIADYDPAWPQTFEREAERIRSILNGRAVRIEHVGSTSVRDLPAKAIIDIVLEVPDSTDEAAYVPYLEAAGYALKIRETDWFEHRLFKGPDVNINLHTFSAGCAETDRMVSFRDWLRTNAADRELYTRTKRELAARSWKYMQQYADAKTAVVGEIMSRAGANRTA
jgi:GrpB-like predicted nucleotidyltransferase (UPF0157 family)